MRRGRAERVERTTGRGRGPDAAGAKGDRRRAAGGGAGPGAAGRRGGSSRPAGELARRTFATAIGPVTVVAGPRGLVRVVLPGSRERAGDGGAAEAAGAVEAGRGGSRRADRLARRAEREITEFLDGRRRRFTVPADLSAVSPFDRAVYAAVRRIPFGRTATYGEVARRLGRPGAARAVGGAVGRNPVPLLVPCHRVVAARGLGGFGPGPVLKRRLLALEGVQVDAARERPG